MELAAGLLIIVMSLLHINYGEKNPIAAISTLTDNSILIGSMRVMSIQGGIILFAVGVVHVLQFLGVITLAGVAAYFPLGVICLNFFTFLIVAILKHKDLFSIITFQIVGFSIIILLQILSMV